MTATTPRIDAIETTLDVTGRTNLLINGAFDFWQRGTSTTITGAGDQAFVADRWKMRASGSGPSKAITRDETEVLGILGQPFKYSMKVESLGGSTSSSAVTQQRIEASNIRHYIGKTLTFSFWIKSTNTIVPISSLTPVSGLEDQWNADISSDTQDFAVNIAITPNVWQKVSYTFTVPPEAINGYSIGPHQGYGDTGNISYMTGFMLNEGSQPADFQRAGRNIADELAMCNRYYQKITITGPTGPAPIGMGHGFNSPNTEGRVCVPLVVPMRTVPGISTSGGGNGLEVEFSDVSSGALVTPTTNFGGISMSNSLIVFPIDAGATVIQDDRLILKLDNNDSLNFDAEL